MRVQINVVINTPPINDSKVAIISGQHCQNHKQGSVSVTQCISQNAQFNMLGVALFGAI